MDDPFGDVREQLMPQASQPVETATQTLHRLTSFTWAWYGPARENDDLIWSVPVDDPRVVQDLVTNDPDRFPWFFKRYAQDLPRVPLPPDLPATAAPVVAVLAGSANVARAELDLPHLSRLLHLSAGVVRTTETRFGRWFFRAAGSAGGRFPLEVYVAIADDQAVPAGLYWYHPLDHALVRIGPAPRGDAPSVIVTGVPWRTGWRYRERGYRHVYWDAGTMLSQLLAAADSAGLGARLYTRFPDAAVAELVGADRVHEWPVAVVALGEGGPALEATGPAATGQVESAPLEFPLITAAQRAGERDSLGPPWAIGEPVELHALGTDPLETVVLARGSQKRMDRTRGLPQGVLRTCMDAARRGIEVPHFVAVHDVGTIAPGMYRWPDLSAPVRSGPMRHELFVASTDQGLAGDAAFVVIGAADVGALDDREYREAQLAAGLVEGRLHLLAYGLGASACGLTFLDGDIPALLGEPLEGLLLTCVGVPEYASLRGGPPGAPTPTEGAHRGSGTRSSPTRSRKSRTARRPGDSGSGSTTVAWRRLVPVEGDD